ncbi:EAL domain-containing protein [Candidatus Colwellia aromaticivorans]|uniref:EAL domain-containing protein n=1 Tax=Candidatus Colwellia aromaticivorans TaxID=2267621 RepID=UPI000DF1CB51|nr:EAL domain-containing protein [Candidatus Colwellia aromaticivorans]
MKRVVIPHKNKILIIASLYVLWVIGFTYFSALQEKVTLYNQLDRQLEDASLTARLLLPETLHYKGMQADSLTEEQIYNNILALSAFTDQRDIIYLYTLILRKDKVLFTSSSATPEERESGEKLSFYFDHYDDVDPRVFDIFNNKKKSYLEYTDQWGTFRSVFIPSYSEDGTFYLAVADLSISHIEALLNQQVYRSLAIAVLFLLFGYPLYRVATSRLTTITNEQRETIRHQTSDLRLSEERLSHAMSSAHQSWFDANLLTGDVEVSDEFPKLLDLPHTRLKFNLNIWQRNIHPDDKDSVLSFFDECLKTDGPTVAEYRIKAATGNWQWLSSVGQIIEWDEDNKPIRMIGINRNITDQKRSELVLQALAETGISTAEGDIFKTIVRQLALSHDMRYAFIATLNEDDNTQANVIAVWANGEFGENFSYSLIGTPCATVVNDDDKVSFWPNDIQQLFPEDLMLVDMAADSYIGVALKDGTGKTIGLLSMVDDQPMSNYQTTLGLLKSLAARAAIEIERVKSTVERERTAAALHQHQEQVLQNQHVLLKLGKETFLDQNDAFTKIITVDAQQLEVSRVSVWLFNEDRTAFICQALYSHGELATELLTLQTLDYPRYFEVLNDTGFIVANDAQHHPSTQELREGYLIPLGITSILDTPIRIKGKLVGVTCHEHIGPKRTWTTEAEDFARSISDLFAQVLLESERKHAEDLLLESEARLRLSQESGGIGTWEYNFITNKSFCSDNVFQQLKFPRSAENSDWDDVLKSIIPEDHMRVNEAINRHMTESKDIDVEYRITDIEGHRRWMRTKGEIEFNSNGTRLKMRGTIQNISAQKSAEDKLSFMAHYDELTKLPNRALFADRFSQAVARSKRTDKMIAICFIDLDNFKSVNDNFGHGVGDQLLIGVAGRIKETIREVDTVSRQGGDEFALLLTDIESYAQCEQLLYRIRSVLARPYIIDDYPHKVSVSIGTTIYPIDDTDLDILLRHADQAMYKAKLAGKNQQQLFNTAYDQQLRHEQSQLQGIKQALVNKEFQLYYQPKVNMKTGEVFGAEALIRWIHPEKGLIPPLDFLPLIDGTNLEIQIGGWVINQALKQMNHWQQQDIKLEVSINISSHHLESPVFFDQLNEALSKYPNVDSQSLQLEILESSALGDLNDISGIIKSCQDVIGVSVALDDFGTGYSSLTHLRNLSANTIKIDQSFVRNMLEDDDDLALIEGIIGLAKTFNRDVIAEGVETAEHGVLLMRIGCECAQGYGIARPMPADELPHWMQHYTPDESWSIWSGSTWEMSNLPLVLAKSDHIKWIEEIFHVLNGHTHRLELGELTNHNECRLGNWYNNQGKKQFGHMEAFRALESIHIDVHKTGHQIIQLYNEGNKESAILLSKELLALKSKVLESLTTLQKHVNFLL